MVVILDQQFQLDSPLPDGEGSPRPDRVECVITDGYLVPIIRSGGIGNGSGSGGIGASSIVTPVGALGRDAEPYTLAPAANSPSRLN